MALDSLCLPRSAGGLNLINFHLWNMAAIFKLLWEVLSRKDSLRVQWIHGFYIQRRDLATMQTPQHACWLVRNIFEARYFFVNRDFEVELQKCSTAAGLSIKNAYLSFHPQYQKVPWKHLTMGSKQIPQNRFILRLAIR